MWYLLATYNNKYYNLGAGVNQEWCACAMTCYYQCYDNKKVKLSIVRLSDMPVGKELNTQLDFVKAYKTDHFMNAHLESPDVASRFE